MVFSDTQEKQSDNDSRAIPSGRRLYRELRRIILTLEKFDDLESLLRYVLEALVKTSLENRGVFRGGRLYIRDGDEFRLVYKYGEAGVVELGYSISIHYGPIQTTLNQGWVLCRPNDPGYDPKIEEPLGNETFAALALGPRQEYILSFSLDEPVPDEEITYTLVVIRQIVELVFRKRELSSYIADARAIQTQLLPDTPPEMPGYEITFYSRSAEIIGGDIYDFIPLGRGIMGIVVGDATGHGLPAALQARDVIIGLRMGVEENLKIVKTIEKLARVIQQTSIKSRFISLFYGEIEPQGYIVYVNAGHVPPLLYRCSTSHITFLKEGGPILGFPLTPEYRRGFDRMNPGDILMLYTDGITEVRNSTGNEMGVEPLIHMLQENCKEPVSVLINEMREMIEQFSRGEPPLDDQTLVLIKRL